jgi:hypothetical protein
MMAYLSLIIAILAVFLGPVISWAIAARANGISAREAWIREFRENLATLLAAYDEFVLFCGKYSSDNPIHEETMVRLNSAQRVPYHKLRLLIAAHKNPDQGFLNTMDKMLTSTSDKNASLRNDLSDAGAVVLRRENDLVLATPDIWAAIGTSLGRGRWFR